MLFTCMAMKQQLFLFATCFTASTTGHGFLVNPTARNAVDKDLPLFHNVSTGLPIWPVDSKGTPGCYPTHGSCGCYCGNGTTPCLSAQSCFWFSQGCTIGCPTCDGNSPRAFRDLCGRGMQATVCDSRLRTYAMTAECNTDADRYRYNPWRAPGKAPVFDPCGKAGGGVNASSAAHPQGAAFFTNTSHNVIGDLGSVVLPEMPSMASWKIGSVVEATWAMRANHGGGYQYRLCSKTDALTEACFQASPIPFVGNQSLLFDNGVRVPIQSAYATVNGIGYFTNDGQSPKGATWARNPIPDNCQAGSKDCTGKTEFTPPCVEPYLLTGTTVGDEPSGGYCSGERPFNVAIIDALRIPKDIVAGEYVLGFRWDCEETAQVWSTCADITIVE